METSGDTAGSVGRCCGFSALEAGGRRRGYSLHEDVGRAVQGTEVRGGDDGKQRCAGGARSGCASLQAGLTVA